MKVVYSFQYFEMPFQISLFWKTCVQQQPVNVGWWFKSEEDV